MKRLIIFVMTVLLIGCATMREVPVEERQIQKVYDLPKMSKNEIYDKTLSWMAETFVSSKKVIELADKDNGKIIGNAATTYDRCGMVNVTGYYTLIIEIKDERLRLTAKDFYWIGTGPERAPGQYEADVIPIKENVDKMSDKLVEYLKQKNEQW